MFLLSSWQSATSLFAASWFIVGGDATHATFAKRSTIAVPVNEKALEVRTIARRSSDGVKSVVFAVSIRCTQHEIAYLSLKMLTTGGQVIGNRPVSKTSYQKINRGTSGEVLWRFACTPASLGYPIMLGADTVADQFFRFIGLQIPVDPSSALAAIDARRAPQAFEDLLNVLVVADRQDYVRAIKTPEVAVD